MGDMPWRSIRAASKAAIKRKAVLDVAGIEHLPSSGPVLLAARHYHHLFDGACLVATIPRPVTIIVGLDWIQSGALRGGMSAACKAAGWPIVYRSNAQQPVNPALVRASNLNATKISIQHLREGKIVIVFPEGFPNIDPGYTPKTAEDEFLPFEPGVVRMATIAARAGVHAPIVPVGFSYQRGDKWRIQMRFGAPITVERRTDETDALARIESEVRRLSHPT